MSKVIKRLYLLWKSLRVLYNLIRATIFFKSIPVWIKYKLHKNSGFEQTLSIAAIIKNETPYLREWLEYHLMLGVEKFYIYDNESTDDLKSFLSEYIDKGIVEYFYFPGSVMQMKAYTHAVKHFKYKTKWMALIDADEYILPLEKNKITDVLDELESTYKNFFGLGIHWSLFGYSNHKTKPEGLIIENYIKNDGLDKRIKSIVNPRTVVYINHPHFCYHLFNITNINENGKRFKYPLSSNSNATENDFKKIRINHYVTKSYEEYVAKRKRGLPDRPEQVVAEEYDENFYSHFSDTLIIEKFLAPLKQRLGLNDK